MNQPHPLRWDPDVELLALVRATPAFAHLPESVLASLSRRMTRLQLEAGEVLLEKGAPGEAMYLVIGGELRADAGPEAAAPAAPAAIGPGELLGEMQILIGSPHAATRIDVPVMK